MVSVIIPTYNYGRYIADTLRSLTSQSDGNWECIIVDNGSTDNTPEVVDGFLDDKRISYFKQENKGVSHARNTGLKAAKGDLILFLDADDLIETEKIKESNTFLANNPSADLVYSDVRYFKSSEPSVLYFSYACDPRNDKPWMRYVSGKGAGVVSELLDGNVFVISSPVFRRSIITGVGLFDESLGHNEDWDFWLRIALSGKEVKHLDALNTRALIRVHDTSASVNLFKMQVGGLKVLLKNSTAIKECGLQRKLDERIRAHVQMIEATLFNGTAGTYRDRSKEIKKDSVLPGLFSFIPRSFFIFKLLSRFKRRFS